MAPPTQTRPRRSPPRRSSASRLGARGRRLALRPMTLRARFHSRTKSPMAAAAVVDEHCTGRALRTAAAAAPVAAPAAALPPAAESAAPEVRQVANHKSPRRRRRRRSGPHPTARWRPTSLPDGRAPPRRAVARETVVPAGATPTEGGGGHLPTSPPWPWAMHRCRCCRNHGGGGY